MCNGIKYGMALDFSTTLVVADLYHRILYPAKLLIKCGFSAETLKTRSKVASSSNSEKK